LKICGGNDSTLVWEIKGQMQKKRFGRAYRYVHKVKIEVVVPDEMVETVVKTIQAHAHTGNPGDGRYSCMPLTTSSRSGRMNGE
jgi:nitrogen regulatory protein P-II 1